MKASTPSPCRPRRAALAAALCVQLLVLLRSAAPASAAATLQPLPRARHATSSTTGFNSTLRTITARTTFYGSLDNCPPGGAIAHPLPGRPQAGGVGTWQDPITFAGDPRATPPGSKLYVPHLKKYFIMMDDCQECIRGWNSRHQYHFDLWMGSDAVPNNPGNLIACEDTLTQGSVQVILNPGQGMSVDSTPLFNAGTGQCIQQVHPCHSNSNQCGNLCQIPRTESCSGLEQLLHMSSQRFHQLNPHVNCQHDVRQGTTVCMGGPCGN